MAANSKEAILIVAQLDEYVVTFTSRAWNSRIDLTLCRSLIQTILSSSDSVVQFIYYYPAWYVLIEFNILNVDYYYNL